jgi:hypothetical protein
MELENLIISVYVRIDQTYQDITGGCPIRRGGFAPALSDPEVITMEIIGEITGHNGDRAIWKYFHSHWADWFPGLGSYKVFAKHCANLCKIKQCIMALLFPKNEVIHVIDGVPMPVCRPVRASRYRSLREFCAWGYCASKKEHYYGMRGHAVMNVKGYIVDFINTPANVDEREVLGNLTGEISGLLIGDKGFIDKNRNECLMACGIDLQTPLRKNMPDNRPKSYIKTLMRMRKPVETAFSVLIDSFNLLKIKAHNMWHFANKLTRKILAYNFYIMFRKS